MADMSKQTITLGKQLSAARERHRYTQKACAKALGISQGGYADMEGGRSRVRRRDLVTLAVLFGVPLEEAFPAFAESSESAAEKVS